MLEKGLARFAARRVQIHTGDGKGKTTAAFGLVPGAAEQQDFKSVAPGHKLVSVS